jgi:2-dehydro-3-deoxygluconokinase
VNHDDKPTSRQLMGPEPKGVDVAFFSGITIAILPKGDRDRFLAILAAFKAAGGTVVFDPNLRPKL